MASVTVLRLSCVELSDCPVACFPAGGKASISELLGFSSFGAGLRDRLYIYIVVVRCC